MNKLSLLAIVCIAFLSACAAPPVVTPKPDIRPVAASNKKIRESVKKIHESTSVTLKLNQDIQANLDSGISALDKLLKQ